MVSFLSLRSSRPKVISPEKRFMSPEILSCSTTSKHLNCACSVSPNLLEKDILLIYLACFVSQHRCLKNETLLHNYPACFFSLSLERDIFHKFFIKISGDLTKYFGRHNSGFGWHDFWRDDFRATWSLPFTHSDQKASPWKLGWAPFFMTNDKARDN